MKRPWKNNSLENEILGINERNLSYVYKWNSRNKFKLADDKILCKEVLQAKGISCPKTYGVISRIGDIQQIWGKVKHHDKLAIKPANGSGGGGILILKKDDHGLWTSGGKVMKEEAIFVHVARLLMGMYSFGSSDRVLIEQCVIPHAFFAEIYPAGVPDFRIILLKDQPTMSMLRVPTDRSDGKANLHQGGLGIGIDMANGTLKQAYDGNLYWQYHPDNGNRIMDKEIPMWAELVELSVQTSKAFPLEYLGVDIVIDKMEGPMIMEINVRPGLGIQLANKKGLKPLLASIQ